MRKGSQQAEESAPKVPGYIVTFSDMVTLLLTFFVMLLSLATVQDPDIFNRGRESFWRSIRQQGLGVLFGAVERPNFGNVKVKYFIEIPDENAISRTIDAKEEEIRRIFQKVSRSMKSIPSEMLSRKTNFSVTDIRFLPGESILDESAKSFLTQFVLDSQQTFGTQTVGLYVLGLATEGATEKKQWMLSAERAEAVAKFMQDTLPTASNWPVYAWGAGPGGDWVGQDSPISKQSQILIAALREVD